MSIFSHVTSYIVKIPLYDKFVLELDHSLLLTLEKCYVIHIFFILYIFYFVPDAVQTSFVDLSTTFLWLINCRCFHTLMLHQKFTSHENTLKALSIQKKWMAENKWEMQLQYFMKIMELFRASVESDNKVILMISTFLILLILSMFYRAQFIFIKLKIKFYHSLWRIFTLI